MNKMIPFGLMMMIGCTHGHALEGQAYKATIRAAKYDGYTYGGKTWQDDHDKWLNAEDNEPMPEELDHIKGDGYLDGGPRAAAYEGQDEE